MALLLRAIVILFVLAMALWALLPRPLFTIDIRNREALNR